MKKLHLALLLSCLLLGICLLAACTGSGSGADTTTGGADTAAEAPGTDAPVPGPDTDAPDTGSATDALTDAPTEAPTEPATEFPVPEAKRLGPANVALGCPVITNDCKNGTNQKLTDGDGDTDYTSNTHSEASYRTFPFEILVDLTKSYPVSGVNIVNSQKSPARTLGAFTLYASTDGRTFTEIGSDETAETGELGITVNLGKAVDARYVKVVSSDLSAVQSGNWSLVLAEIEVMAEVDTHDNILPSKRALAMQPGCTDDLTAVFRLSGDPAALTWVSADPRVCAVSADGHVRALADGETTLYVHDNDNWTAVPVTVKTPVPQYTISTFYLADHAPNTLETFDYLKESGITFIENCRPYDYYGNLDTEYLRVWAADYGITLSVADPVKEDAWLSQSEDSIRAIVKKYKNLPGIGGIYLRDEPSQPSRFASVYRTVRMEDPSMRPHLNLLPNVVGSYETAYVGDWAATVGSDMLACLGYDMYPFGIGANSFNNSAYDHLDLYRRAGLKYNVDTGYYLAAMGIVGAYREPKENEMLFYASLGVAYGMKEYKWFVWFTPPYSGSGEHFTSGILNGEYQKSDMFEGVKKTDEMLMSLSPYLANTDAIAVYHTDGQNGEKAPADFCIVPTSKRGTVISVLEDRTTGQQYLVFVSKTFMRAADMTLKVQDAGLDVSALRVIADGEPGSLTIKDGEFTMSVEAGCPVVLMLPEGYRAYARPENDGTERSLVADVGASVSSSAGDSRYAAMINDGKTDTAWASAKGDAAPYVYFDLRLPRTFNRVDVYAGGPGMGFPQALSVWVSDNAADWQLVSSVQETGKGVSLTFETVTARWVMVTADAMPASGTCEIGEIEIYMDNGQLPKMEIAEETELIPDEKGNLLHGVKPYVSSSYEEYGFTQAQLTDGKIGFVNGVHQGWCSQIGSKTRDITEWVMFALGKPIRISKMIVYPCYDDEFVQDYHLEVSTDGEHWTTVWSIEGDNMNDGSPRVLEFTPVTAGYVRFVVTKMGVGNPNSAVGYKVQIGEIELYK